MIKYFVDGEFLYMLFDDDSVGRYLKFDKVVDNSLLSEAYYITRFDYNRKYIKSDFNDANWIEWADSPVPNSIKIDSYNPLQVQILDNNGMKMSVNLEIEIEPEDIARYDSGKLVINDDYDGEINLTVSAFGLSDKIMIKNIKPEKVQSPIDITYQAIAELSIRQAELEKENQELREELKHLERS